MLQNLSPTLVKNVSTKSQTCVLSLARPMLYLLSYKGNVGWHLYAHYTVGLLLSWLQCIVKCPEWESNLGPLAFLANALPLPSFIIITGLLPPEKQNWGGLQDQWEIIKKNPISNNTFEIFEKKKLSFRTEFLELRHIISLPFTVQICTSQTMHDNCRPMCTYLKQYMTLQTHVVTFFFGIYRCTMYFLSSIIINYCTP